MIRPADLAASRGARAAPSPAPPADGLVDVRTPKPAPESPPPAAPREQLSRTALRALRLKPAPEAGA